MWKFLVIFAVSGCVFEQFKKCVYRGLKVTQCLEDSFCGVEKIEHFISGYGIKVTGYLIDGNFVDEIQGLTGCDFKRYEASCMQVKGIEILECLNEANCYGLVKIEHVLGENLEVEEELIIESKDGERDGDVEENGEIQSEEMESDGGEHEYDELDETYKENDEVYEGENVNINLEPDENEELDEQSNLNEEVGQYFNEINELAKQSKENQELESDINNELDEIMNEFSDSLESNGDSSGLNSNHIKENLQDLKTDNKEFEVNQKINEELLDLQELLKKSIENANINDFYANLERMKKEIETLEQEMKEKEMFENEITETNTVNDQTSENKEYFQAEINSSLENTLIVESKDLNLYQTQEKQEIESKEESSNYLSEEYEKDGQQENNFSEENKELVQEIKETEAENKYGNSENETILDENQEHAKENKDIAEENKINEEYDTQEVGNLPEVESEVSHNTVPMVSEINQIENIQALHENSHTQSVDSSTQLNAVSELEEKLQETENSVETNYQNLNQNDEYSQADPENYELSSLELSNKENIGQNNEEVANYNEDTVKKTAENRFLNRENTNINENSQTQNTPNQFLKTSNLSPDECTEDCKNICLKKSEQVNCMKECTSNFCAIELSSNSDYYTVILTGVVLFLIVGIIYLFMQNKSMRMAIEHGEFGVATYSHISS